MPTRDVRISPCGSANSFLRQQFPCSPLATVLRMGYWNPVADADHEQYASLARTH
jgi:hypothetical protein